MYLVLRAQSRGYFVGPEVFSLVVVDGVVVGSVSSWRGLNVRNVRPSPSLGSRRN